MKEYLETLSQEYITDIITSYDKLFEAYNEVFKNKNIYEQDKESLINFLATDGEELFATAYAEELAEFKTNQNNLAFEKFILETNSKVNDFYRKNIMNN